MRDQHVNDPKLGNAKLEIFCVTDMHVPFRHRRAYDVLVFFFEGAYDVVGPTNFVLNHLTLISDRREIFWNEGNIFFDLMACSFGVLGRHSLSVARISI
jgi:hypothetical protein